MGLTKRRTCIDCSTEGITTRRKAPHPGPRCATHHRAKRTARRKYVHSTHIMEKYGLTTEEYEAIIAFQGGHCAICNRAKGIRRRLSVDHCHETGEVRGALCNTCNRMLGHLRDDQAAFFRAADYLRNPPARIALGGIRIVPEDGAPVKRKEVP